MNAMLFLVDTLIKLYLMVVILRLWLQLARADFYNPFSQFVVKATQPILKPLRRVLPSMGAVDTASVVLALAIGIGYWFAMTGIAGQPIQVLQALYLGVLTTLKEAGMLLFWILLIRAILSWVSQGRSPIEYVMAQLTEPFLAPIRRRMPDLGGLDLSMLVVFLILNVINMLLLQYLPGWQAA